MRPSEALQIHRDAIREIALKQRVRNVRVFGSVLHGDDTEESDLDLLAEPTAETTLFDKRIHSYVENMDEVAFLNDRKSQDALIRNFEVVGEAPRNIEPYHKQFADTHDFVPFGSAYEMRNALAHGYFNVDLEIVWKTISNNLAEFHTQIQQRLLKQQLA
jgi:uncharacterized protein with HEPN domain